MRVLKYVKDEGLVKVKADSVEDLWHIERVIVPGDLVAAKSWRRFKTSEGESGEKKEILVQVRAEQVEFSEHANKVRVTGRIIAGGPEEFIQVGSYHTIDIEPQFAVDIKKAAGWRQYELDRLYNAQRAAKKVHIAIVVMDERNALFANVKEYKVDFAFEIESHASKRDKDSESKRLQYYGDVMKALSELKADVIVVAGPGFAKDGLRKFIADRAPELLKRLHFETASSAEHSGVYELLKQGVADKILGEDRTAKEFALIEEMMVRISKDTGLAAYGVAEVRKAVESSAAEKLLVTDALLRKDKAVEALLEDAEKLRCEIRIFNSENPPGQQLAGLGGIAALLRFKIA